MDNVPLLRNPTVARIVASAMQGGMRLGAGRMAAASAARFPEYPGGPELLEAPTPFGTTELRIFRPAGGPATMPPVYVNFHGGGYVMDLTVMDDALCRVVAAVSGAVVVNAPYVVAPRHPFPAPVEHAFSIVGWVAGHGAQHGWDGERLAVGGQSAGGGLAAAVARLAFERGGPELRLQVLHYPPLDLTVPARLKHSPLRRPVLRPWMGEVFDAAYAPDPATRADRLISPASAADTADLTGIAPAVVITAANDILREEGGRYAQRLREVGALVAHREIPGADHGYDGTDDALALASYRAIGADLSRALAGSPRPIRAASATILDEQGRVLLVLRGFEPGKGRWSVPGGRCEPEETLAETAAREVLEETGLQVEVGEELWAVVIPAGHGRVFEARNFAAKVTGGELTPGDDADDARWVADAELDSLPLTHDLAGHLRRAGVFSRD